MWIDIVGYVAGILVTGSLLPQTIRTWKTKSTEDLSLWRYIIYMSGLALWIAYAFIVNVLPVAIMNALGFVLAGSILYVKLRYS